MMNARDRHKLLWGLREYTWAGRLEGGFRSVKICKVCRCRMSGSRRRIHVIGSYGLAILYPLCEKCFPEWKELHKNYQVAEELMKDD